MARHGAVDIEEGAKLMAGPKTDDNERDAGVVDEIFGYVECEQQNRWTNDHARRWTTGHHAT
jgi:hypothetical protein